MVIWIIGLSGAGKSTLGNQVLSGLKQRGIQNVVNLDGDFVREAFLSTFSIRFVSSLLMK